MLRWLALVALLSGCLGAAPGPVPPAQAADEGLSVVAVRVEPLVHAVEVRDHLSWRACAGTGSGCQDSAGRLGGSPGYEWETDTHDFADAQALFWRIAFDLKASNDSGAPVPLRLEVSVTKPCGGLCVQERVIERIASEGRIEVPARDVYLEPGETGVRLRIGTVQEPIPLGSIAYTLQGQAAGFRPVAPPMVLA